MTTLMYNTVCITVIEPLIINRDIAQDHTEIQRGDQLVPFINTLKMHLLLNRKCAIRQRDVLTILQ